MNREEGDEIEYKISSLIIFANLTIKITLIVLNGAIFDFSLGFLVVQEC